MRWVLVVASAALGLLWTVRVVGSAWGGWYWLPGLLLDAALCWLLAHRERPWAVCAGLALTGVGAVAPALVELPSLPGPGAALALAGLVAAAVRYGDLRTEAAVIGANAVIVALSALGGNKPLSAFSSAWGVPGGWSVAPVAVLTGVLFVAAVSAGLLGRWRDARKAAEVEEVRRAERLELARELHDLVAHHVTGVVVQAQAARLVHRKKPEEVDSSLEAVEAAGSAALAAMRGLVGVLRDSDGAAPREPVADLVRRFGEHGPRVRLSLPERPWPAEVDGTVYRVVQEALTNTARHAPDATEVAVTVTDTGDTVTVEVSDNGRGDGKTGHGYGLLGLAERVAALGGELRAGPSGPGWTVTAALPVRRP